MKNSVTIKEMTRAEGNHMIRTNEIVTLYHGSKSGIRGKIAPISRERCDFGRGFYIGTDRTQPLTLICNYPDARIYTLSADLSDLRILDIEVGLDWALLVAYNRGKMDAIKGSAIYDRFFNGEITDMALVNSLSALKPGRQYAALTEKACKKIRILDEQKFTEDDRKKLKQESEANRSKGIAMADEICRKYRRDGMLFDEILKAGE